VDPSCPLTAETGNCRNRHGRHWAAFCSLAVSALSQHRWRYGRPISITYSTGVPINIQQLQCRWRYGRPISITYSTGEL